MTEGDCDDQYTEVTKSEPSAHRSQVHRCHIHLIENRFDCSFVVYIIMLRRISRGCSLENALLGLLLVSRMLLALIRSEQHTFHLLLTARMLVSCLLLIL